MKYARGCNVVVADRQRKEITRPELEMLKRSILSKGLLHPIVLSVLPDDQRIDDKLDIDGYLIAGERRLRAITELHIEGHTPRCNGEPIPTDMIPFLIVSDLSPDDIMEAELEENLLRAPLTWLETVEAKTKIHEARKALNPSQTFIETAKEVAGFTGQPINTERQDIARAVILSKNKDNPRVRGAKTEAEAWKAILDEAESKFRKDLYLSEASPESPHAIMHMDCREAFEQIPPNSISTILFDPPYGIAADKQGKESDHYYDDSPDYAMEICEFVIREGFKLCKSRAILFMFCDIEHFVHLRTYASQHAWTPFRTPLIWKKEGDTGSAPWGKAGFRRTYECILFAVKGQQELRVPGGPDVFEFKRTGRAERVHAAEKPFELLEFLVSISTLPGELLLDPCAGSGSIIPAADRHKVRTICIERDETYYAEIVGRLQPPTETAPKNANSGVEAQDDEIVK